MIPAIRRPIFRNDAFMNPTTLVPCRRGNRDFHHREILLQSWEYSGVRGSKLGKTRPVVAPQPWLPVTRLTISRLRADTDTRGKRLRRATWLLVSGRRMLLAVSTVPT